MSTPAKVGRGIKEEEKGTDSTPVQVASRVEKERGTATSKVKAEAGRGGTHVNITVRNATGEDVFFRVKRNEELGPLMNTYCDKHCIDRHGVSFYTDDCRIRYEATPDDIGLEDGDEIHVSLHRSGS